MIKPAKTGAITTVKKAKLRNSSLRVVGFFFSNMCHLSDDR